LKNPNFNIKYLPNGREYLNSAKTGESGVKNWISLNYFRFLGLIAEWEKQVGSMDLVHLSGGLLVNYIFHIHKIWNIGMPCMRRGTQQVQYSIL
jgi:hypothetical protein